MQQRNSVKSVCANEHMLLNSSPEMNCWCKHNERMSYIVHLFCCPVGRKAMYTLSDCFHRNPFLLPIIFTAECSQPPVEEQQSLKDLIEPVFMQVFCKDMSVLAAMCRMYRK